MDTQNINEPNHDTLPPPSVISVGSEFGAAYERRLGEIKAVPDEALATINIDVQASVATILGALPEIRALRDELGKLPNFDLSLVDGLEDFAEAAGEANSRFVLAMAPSEDVVALHEAAVTMRDTIHSDAVALANRGLIDPGRLAPFKNLKGYKNVAFELFDWANLMAELWPSIHGKTALSLDEIRNAKQLGERLVRAAGLREQGPATIGETARIRQQAVTLLVRAYDEVRRGVSFLRWREDDVDTIAPSLYAGRGGHKRTDQTPVAPNGNVTAPPGDAPAANPGAPAQPAAPVAAPAAGLPGMKPFALV